MIRPTRPLPSPPSSGEGDKFDSGGRAEGLKYDLCALQTTLCSCHDALVAAQNYIFDRIQQRGVSGYWPSFLFSYLTDSASMIKWGGEVVNSETDGEHTSTQMGSGHFPEEGFSKASYFRNIQVVDGSNNLRSPKEVGTFTEQSNCYDVQNGNNGDWGHYFYL